MLFIYVNIRYLRVGMNQTHYECYVHITCRHGSHDIDVDNTNTKWTNMRYNFLHFTFCYIMRENNVSLVHPSYELVVAYIDSRLADAYTLICLLTYLCPGEHGLSSCSPVPTGPNVLFCAERTETLPLPTFFECLPRMSLNICWNITHIHTRHRSWAEMRALRHFAPGSPARW